MKTAVIVLALCCAAAHVRAADDTAAIETSRHPHEDAEPPAAGPGALGLELLEIRRIHVEPLSGGEAAQQLRDMVISELRQTGLFILTEDPDRADAILRGSADDILYTEQFAAREGADARSAVRIPLGQGTRFGRSLGLSAGGNEHEYIRKTERKHEAQASVRLFNKDGDILWATVQQSNGGKFHSAPADVARKIAKDLRTFYDKVARQAPRAESGGARSVRPVHAAP